MADLSLGYILAFRVTMKPLSLCAPSTLRNVFYVLSLRSWVWLNEASTILKEFSLREMLRVELLRLTFPGFMREDLLLLLLTGLKVFEEQSKEHEIK